MNRRTLTLGLVSVVSGGVLSACGNDDEDTSSVASPAQSANAPAIATATAQSELEDTWTPTPEPEHDEGGEGEGGPSGPVEIHVSAVDIAFDVTELEAPADTDFTVTLTNDGAADHDFVIEGTDFATAVLAGGESETITVNLPAGDYVFFCSVPGHRAAGMEGTLTVAEGLGGGGEEEHEGEGGAPAGPVDVQVEAVDIAFDKTEIEAPADADFTVTLTNNGAADHDFVIEDTDFATAVLAGGESETITVNLPEGEYTFYCSVPGHRQAGMEGTLRVTPGGGAQAGAPPEEPAGEATAAGDEAAGGASTGEPIALTITAVDIAFDQTELMGPADVDFTITLNNDGAAQHDFVIRDTDFATSILNGGDSETITVNLPSGEYEYFCSIPGHEAAGMKGVLTIVEGDVPSSDGGAQAASPVATPDAGSDGGATELAISAVDIAFDTTELTAPADTDFTITLTNDGAAQHDFVIEDTDFATAILNGGESETITVNLPAGEYTYFCSVPGHRPAGMEGTLTVS